MMVGSIAVKVFSSGQRLHSAALPWVCVARSVAESQDAAVRKLWRKTLDKYAEAGLVGYFKYHGVRKRS